MGQNRLSLKKIQALFFFFLTLVQKMCKNMPAFEVRSVGRMAYAEDCKSFYTGSIPVPTSKKVLFMRKKDLQFCFFWCK